MCQDTFSIKTIGVLQLEEQMDKTWIWYNTLAASVVKSKWRLNLPLAESGKEPIDEWGDQRTKGTWTSWTKEQEVQHWKLSTNWVLKKLQISDKLGIKSTTTIKQPQPTVDHNKLKDMQLDLHCDL